MNLDDLEKKLEEFTEKLDKRFDELARRLEDRFSGPPAGSSENKTPRKRESPFWGIVLVLLGFVLLANHLDWFDARIPLIPTALLLLGLFLIIENK